MQIITLDSEAEGLNLPKTDMVPLLPVKHCRLVQKTDGCICVKNLLALLWC